MLFYTSLVLPTFGIIDFLSFLGCALELVKVKYVCLQLSCS